MKPWCERYRNYKDKMSEIQRGRGDGDENKVRENALLSK